MPKKAVKKESSLTKYKKIAKEANDKHVRLLAEFDNFKKRTFHERQNSQKYEGEDFIKSILPIVDDLDRVLNIKELKNYSSIYDGLNLLADKFKSILQNNHLYLYNSIGAKFDPELHEALMTKKVKNKKNIIVEEYQSGYKYHDKVIRHAKVIVGE